MASARYTTFGSVARRQSKKDRQAWAAEKGIQFAKRDISKDPSLRALYVISIVEDAEAGRLPATALANHDYIHGYHVMGNGSLVTKPVPEMVVVKDKPKKKPAPKPVLLFPATDLQRIAASLVAEMKTWPPVEPLTPQTEAKAA